MKKMRNKLRGGALLLLVVLLVFAGCGRSEGPSAKIVALEEASIREAVLVADPEAALEEIYGELEAEAVQLRSGQLKDTLGIESKDLDEFYVFQSNAKKGLSDVMLLKPLSSADREELRKQLYLYKDKRITEFQNFDILDSFEIAQNAVIYDQGDYIILLMLKDNDTAQDIIDLYIPQ